MKIPSTTRSQKYECTYLTPVGLTTDEQKKLAEKVAKLVKKHTGTIASTEDWGKKVLAYTIKKESKKHTEAIYTHMVVEFDTANVTAFEKELYLQPEIIRHLLVIASEPSDEVQSESTEVESE